MAKIPSSHTWVKFFQDAGIPVDLSAQYAVMFTDHRIQRDMLSELDRDILSDIGIKAVGDKMAILKHARFISEQSRRDASSKQLADGLKNSSKTVSVPVRPAAALQEKPKARPLPRKKIQPPAVKDVESRIDESDKTPKSEKKTVFQRLGNGIVDVSSPSSKETPPVLKNPIVEQKSSLESVQSTSVIQRLGAKVLKIPNPTLSLKTNVRKTVTLKKKTSPSVTLRMTVDRPSKPNVLERLGREIRGPSSTVINDKIAPKPKVILLTSSKNRNLIKISPPKRKQNVDIGKVVLPAKKPISSNTVSSTSAGLFRGCAKTGSSVFDRLGPK